VHTQNCRSLYIRGFDLLQLKISCVLLQVGLGVCLISLPPKHKTILDKMAWITRTVLLGLACSYTANSQAIIRARDLPSVSLPILATTPNVESDKVFFSYGKKPLFIGNDGSADLGGIHVFDVLASSKTPDKLPEIYSKITGRTKVVSAVYSVDDEDYIVTFSTPEHLLRFYELPSGKEVKSATKFILAEFSALCSWRSPVTNAVYIYLFGKKEVRMYLLKEEKSGFAAVEVRR